MFTQDDYINEIETARENGEKKGRELGLEAGRAEGEERKAVEVAKAMKGDGMSCEQISKFTGLTKDQIEAL